jgi:alkanesulfonate monooxygenase SsuD/methylene tetrahydromethanopterin reductase-like flavin-dependent oxidoreductase (luciferase family)
VDLDAFLSGTPDQIVARLREYADAGVERVMFQHLLHRDTAALELIAGEVMPALAG